MIAPSHGAIWRRFLPQILQQYQQWATYQTAPQAAVVYDTMWGSTDRMAGALRDGLEAAGIPVTMHNLKTSHISDAMTTVLGSRLVCIGSPTLNGGVLPSIGAFLTYLKGLRPKHRVGLAFGSYGWGGQSIPDIEAVMNALAWEMPEHSLKTQYIPDENDLKTVYAAAQRLGAYIKDQNRVHATGAGNSQEAQQS